MCDDDDFGGDSADLSWLALWTLDHDGRQRFSFGALLLWILIIAAVIVIVCLLN